MDAILVKRDGKVTMDQSFDMMCSLLKNGEYIVSIKRKTKPRTISQNSLMWMWYKCMEDVTGQSKDDYHDYFKAKFLSRQVSIGNKVFLVAGSTKTLNTLQMTDFLNKVQADAASEFGIMLPMPEDRHYQAFVEHYKTR